MSARPGSVKRALLYIGLSALGWVIGVGVGVLVGFGLDIVFPRSMSAAVPMAPIGGVVGVVVAAKWLDRTLDRRKRIGPGDPSN
jgi:hypothetical protein